MGEVSAAETLFRTIFMFSKSVSNSSAYRSTRMKFTLLEHRCSRNQKSVCKPPVPNSWRWRSRGRTGPVWHRGSQDPASGPSLGSTPWNTWEDVCVTSRLTEVVFFLWLGFFCLGKKCFLLNTRDVRVSGCSGDNADVSKRFGFCGKKQQSQLLVTNTANTQHIQDARDLSPWWLI